jgi:mannose/fructose/N-acetylgalactosamine-specific phosphotransferase system component IIC
VTDTPTNKKMTMLLLNIPFAIVGVAIAVVPLIIGMKCQDRPQKNEVAASKQEAFGVEPKAKELEHAA